MGGGVQAPRPGAGGSLAAMSGSLYLTVEGPMEPFEEEYRGKSIYVYVSPGPRGKGFTWSYEIDGVHRRTSTRSAQGTEAIARGEALRDAKGHIDDLIARGL